MKSGRFSSRSSQAGSRLFKTGSCHSHNNIFHIYSSNRDEKRPALLNFYLIDLLVCLIFLRSSQPELLEKDSRKVCGHIKIPVHEFIAENEEIY